MIKHYRIKNLKTWADTQEIKTGNITAFFGANSSGKSSLLQFLLLLKQTIENTDRNIVLDFGDDKSYTELGSFFDIIHNHQIELPFEFEFEIELPKEIKFLYKDAGDSDIVIKSKTIKFAASIIQDGKNCITQQFTYQLGTYEFCVEKREKNHELSIKNTQDSSNDYNLRRTQGRKNSVVSVNKFFGFPDTLMNNYQGTAFLSDIQFELEKFFKNLYYLGPLREHPQRRYVWSGGEPSDMGRKGEQTIQALLARGSKKIMGRGAGHKAYSLEEYVAHWLKELGLIHSFKVEEIASNLYEVKVQKTPQSASVLITDVGFGVSQILPVIALCYYVPEGSVILIEQPEIHLHPRIQAGLADVFIDAMKVRKVQIIIESHSEHLLRRLQRRIADETLDNKNCSLYFANIQDTKSKLSHIDLDVFGNITNYPEDFFGSEYEDIKATNQAIQQRKKREKKIV